MAVSGVINLYKPVGASSAHHAYRLRRVFGERRVGHAGTLDPFAEGVLVVCIGTATRLVERLMGLPKEYRAIIRLGVTNATFDPERPFEAVAGAQDPGRSAIERVLAGMIGEFEQVPPRHSAAWIEGRRAYELARDSEDSPAPAAKLVRVDEIRVEAYAWPCLTMTIRCGRGTYIRSIARDLGEALRCGAVCEALSRTAVGWFRMEEAVRLKDSSDEAIRAGLVAPDAILARLVAHAGLT